MAKIKQVIVIRKDLNMRKGKMVASGSHASLKVFFDMMSSHFDQSGVTYKFTATIPMVEWIEGKFTKICVSVDSEEELLSIYKQAQFKKLPCSLIKDCGDTEFKEPTYTACAIGPDVDEIIDTITGHLKLL
jgi:PTH2 family peptidyl-tRNA hydrolase